MMIGPPLEQACDDRLVPRELDPVPPGLGVQLAGNVEHLHQHHREVEVDLADDRVALGLGIAVAERVAEVLDTDRHDAGDRAGRTPGRSAAPALYDCSMVKAWPTPTISRTNR